MLSQEDNDLMCRVGAGTPMGNALRRYWVPVLSSYQLPAPDCDPVSVEIFGEKLVAFRNTEGAIGVLDEHCCHRSASLVLGRVEGCGIRCLFHGWKYAVDGTVMETPNVADPRFRARFKARAYPVREAGGIIWTYVGPKELEPPFPHWPYFDYPSERRLTVTFVVPANFVQVQEALLDSSHLTILHQDSFKRPASADIDFVGNVINVDGRPDPKVEAEETTFGFHYAALRQIQSEQGLKTEARITSYCAPFHILNANGDFVGMVVPIDDYRTLHHFVWWSDSKVISQPPLSTAQLDFVGLGEELLHRTGLHPSSWHEPGKPNRSNNFHQDRTAMRNGDYTGLPNFFPEDAAMMASSGAIRDRTKEMLAPADIAIVRLYQVLLGLAKKTNAADTPKGLNVDPASIRGLHGLVQDGKTWRDLVPEHRSSRSAALTSPAANG